MSDLTGTILIADDDRAIRTVLSQALGRAGYDVRTTGNASMLWRWVSNGEGDLVITDVMMPLMDGPTTIQVLLRLNPQARIIAASGLNANGMVAKAASAGVNHFIPKPYTAETLLKTLRSLLEECMPGR